MSESIEHITLVKCIEQYVKSSISRELYDFIEIDNGGIKPSRVCNYIPDIYFRWGDLLIIGEAKTINDFDRKHSKAQFEAYIDECRWFNGTSTIIIAVPWVLVITAKNYFKAEKEKMNFGGKIIILTELEEGIKTWEI